MHKTVLEIFHSVAPASFIQS